MNSQLEEHNAVDIEIPGEILRFPRIENASHTTKNKISRLLNDMSPEQARNVILLIDKATKILNELQGKANMQIILSILAGSFFVDPFLSIWSHMMGGKEAKLFQELKETLSSLRMHIPVDLLQTFRLEKASGPGNSAIATLFLPLLRAIRRCLNKGSMNEVLEVMNQLKSTLLLRVESASNSSPSNEATQAKRMAA